MTPPTPALVVVFVMVEWTVVQSNLYDPHVRPGTGPFFEGWYMRLVDPVQSHSLGVLWGYVVPENPKSASNLDYIGAVRSDVGVRESLGDYNAFPAGRDTNYTIKDGKHVTDNPDISSPAWMDVKVNNIGEISIKQNSTWVDVAIGDLSVKMSLGAVTPWHEDYTGPEGSVIQRLPLPLHWFVFSLWTPVLSYTITNRSTGRTVAGRDGMVHMEKNWGDSFPESWIWAQGATAQPSKVAFALTYGRLSVLGPPVPAVPASLGGYRNYDKALALDFTPLTSLVTVNYSQCGDPPSLSIQYITPFVSRLNVMVTAPSSSFSSCLFGPLEDGFRRVCQESYVGTAVVQVYAWAWFQWKQVDHQTVPLAALEFGGKWTCQPCQT